MKVEVVVFDFEYLGRCQFPVQSYGTAEPETDCCEPAIAKVFWVRRDDPDRDDSMLVCEKHLDFVRKVEKGELDER